MTRTRSSRRRIDRLLFLGPATIMLLLFFLLPAIVDVAIAFTDMDRSLRVTRFTTENVARLFIGDRRLLGVMSTTLIYVLSTLAFFNVGYALRSPRAPAISPAASWTRPKGCV